MDYHKVTSVKVWSILDGCCEYADLTEEYSDQERSSGRIGGGWQQIRHPGGHREHGGGDEVDVDILPVLAHHVYLDASGGVVGVAAPGLDHTILAPQVTNIDRVATNLAWLQQLIGRKGFQV